MIQTQLLKHLPGARKGERGESKVEVSRRATARGAIDKSKYVKVIEGKEIKGDDPRGSEVLLSPRGVMAVAVPQNEKIFVGKNEGRKKSVLPSVGEERIGGA